MSGTCRGGGGGCACITPRVFFNLEIVSPRKLLGVVLVSSLLGVGIEEVEVVNVETQAFLASSVIFFGADTVNFGFTTVAGAAGVVTNASFQSDDVGLWSSAFTSIFLRSISSSLILTNFTMGSSNLLLLLFFSSVDEDEVELEEDFLFL